MSIELIFWFRWKENIGRPRALNVYGVVNTVNNDVDVDKDVSSDANDDDDDKQ